MTLRNSNVVNVIMIDIHSYSSGQSSKGNDIMLVDIPKQDVPVTWVSEAVFPKGYSGPITCQYQNFQGSHQ